MTQTDIQLLVLLVMFAIFLLQLLLSWLRDKEIKHISQQTLTNTNHLFLINGNKPFKEIIKNDETI